MTPTIVLASQSPRRQQILSQLGLPLLVMASGVSEDVDGSPEPATYATIVALRKAEFVATLPEVHALRRPIIVAADTVVVIDGQILGKPTSADEAYATLQQLRSREHLVHTGQSILDLDSGRRTTSVNTAVVTMRNYSDEEIAAYVATGDPLDKAGSYGIQHPVFRPVQRLDGCFLGVMGLSLCDLIALLAQIDLDVNVSPVRLAALHEGYDCAIMPR